MDSHHTEHPSNKGVLFFPEDKPRIWTVGASVGEQLRNYAKYSELSPAETGRTVRAHLRRGHWHGYWTEPKANGQKFVYKWISPLIAGGHAD